MTRRCSKTPRWLGPKPLDRSDLGIPDEPPARVPPDLDDTIARSASDGALPFPPMFGPGPMIEHGANDLETFRAFFGSLGVPFEEIAGATVPPHATNVLWVAGASFTFDAAGDFLGVCHGRGSTFIARKS